MKKIINNSIVKNSFWMMLEKASRLFIGVTISSLMARSLGPNDFGQLNFLISLLSIASVLSSLGFNRIIVREVANQIENTVLTNRTAVTAFYLRLIMSLVLWIVSIIIGVFFLGDDLLYITIIFASLFFVSFDVFDFYSQGTSKFKVISLCRLSVFFITSSIKLVLIWLDFSLTAFIFMVLIEYILTAMFFYFFFIRKNNIILSYNVFESSCGADLIKESWPEIIAGFGAILFMRIDQIFLQILEGNESVGIYSAATRITEAWYFLPAIIIATTFPKLLALRKESYSSYLNGIRALMSFLVALSVAVAIIFTLCSNWLVLLLFGIEYAESANVIMLHTWGGVFLCMGLASGSWLVAERKLKLNLLRNVFGLIVGSITNWMLIPIYGVTGSAIATVAGLSSAFYFFDILHPQLRTMFWLKTNALLPIYFFKFIRKRN
jgi:O-antigen/teichoic acid export membrane protein